MMRLDANDLTLFACVAETGSFTKAAERLELPKSTISRRIAALEQQLGEILVLRGTRKLTITDFGLNVLDHARAVVAEVDGTLALAQHRQAKPSGRLRVSLLTDLASIALSEMLTEFVRKHPAITLEMDLSSRRVDLIGENFDLALRIGESLEDSDLVARRLVDMTVGLYASPTYLQQAGFPSEPIDLLKLHGLLLPSITGEARDWILERKPAGVLEHWQGKPSQHTLANSPAVLIRMAQAGYGVVTAPDLYAREAVGRGLLMRVLPEWSLAPARVWVVFPGKRLMPARTRAFIEALAEGLSTSTEA